MLRLNAREVLMPKKVKISVFQVADGSVKLCGRGQVFRRSTSIPEYSARGDEHNDVQGESDGSQPEDTLTDDGKARNEFWTIAGFFF